MSCSIPKETKGFIVISDARWDEFKAYVEDSMTDHYITDYAIRVDSIEECMCLVENGFITDEEYSDLENYCDVVEFSAG